MASRISVPSSSAASRRRPVALGAAALFLLLGVGLLPAGGCTLSTAGIDDGSGGTGVTSTTGTGGGPQCTSNSECKDGNPCTDDLCTKGKCENPANDTIVPTDPNPCTLDVCKNGVASHTNVAAGTACGTDLKCDGAGICQCTTNQQCGMPTDCIRPTCDMAKGCVMVLPTDTLPDPTPNDCKGTKCDGMGNAVVYNEDTDKPADDGVVCTDDVCMNGVGSHPASAVGSPCMGSNVCKAAGACVFCTGSFGCNVAGGEYCFNEAACASCSNASQDGDETDLGCGGTHCPKCADGLKCLGGGDCASGSCNSGKCISCTDMLQNGNESDVDCGGSCAMKCADGKVCNGGGDCASGKCSGGKCISCTDGIKNGGESDVDCGGSCATKCANGKICGGGGDCTSTKCADGVCCNASCNLTCAACDLPGKVGTCSLVAAGLTDPGTCSNGSLCDGGGMCVSAGGKKAVGAGCGMDAECFNNACRGVCRLAIGDACASNLDCESLLCANNICANCGSDGDCQNMNTCVGGPTGVCELAIGEPCVADGMNGDCASGHCKGSPKKCTAN